ncbi:GDSL esterase/lipase At5g55050-like [Bidens hawaiensis]|uniref:GDSL esterase/lipase At5g55050-like n=1 Tax=Bidens hawaiensis TaxID=980011 RepID=UPI00404B5683
MPSFISLSLATLFLSALVFGCSDSVPAIYTFGDSLADVGNNNFLSNSILKADFPHNGVDFPTRKPTGRFSNGKNTVDCLSEKVGLPSALPYLSLVSTDTKAMVTGVNFASGSAGILNGTNKPYGPIPLTQQVEYYSLVHNQLVQELGSTRAKIHLAKSLFVIVIGSNDLLFYFRDSQVSKQHALQEYVDLVVSSLKQLMKRLIKLGARKFVVNGVGMIGCCPAQRLQMNTTYGCNVAENYWSKKYNIRLKILLKKLKRQSPGINYSYFDTYRATNNLIQYPQNYGIWETKEACCGIGKLYAEGPCLPNSTYCSNRSDHLFWDLYHPTETVSHILADLIYNGSRQFMFPMNAANLVRI